MSVLIETTEGELVIDLDVDDAPKLCTNFLKLCKVKYYNFAPFFNVNPNFTVQCGDPNYPKGDGGESIWKGTFTAEKSKDEIKRGDVAMALADGTQAGSQFVIALGDIGESLKNKAAVFGAIVEGFETLDKINKAYCDDDKRPLKDIRIKHAYILEDPFDDPPGVGDDVASPEQPSDLQRSTMRLGEDDLAEDELDDEEKEKRRLQQQSRSQALTLEIMGDLPFAEVRPQENILFVCKLNPATNDEDLELIFSRFGKIVSCEIVRDQTTRESKQYAFIEFESREDCEMAYYKMEGVLIDDRRIHVDFSQSVSHLSESWRNSQNSKRRAAHGSRFVPASSSSSSSTARAAPPSSSPSTSSLSRTSQRYSSHRPRDGPARDREKNEKEREKYRSSRTSRDDRYSSRSHSHRSDRDRSRDRQSRDDRYNNDDDRDRRRRHDKDRNRHRERDRESNRDRHRHRSSSPRR